MFKVCLEDVCEVPHVPKGNSNSCSRAALCARRVEAARVETHPVPDIGLVRSALLAQLPGRPPSVVCGESAVIFASQVQCSQSAV